MPSSADLPLRRTAVGATARGSSSPTKARLAFVRDVPLSRTVAPSAMASQTRATGAPTKAVEGDVWQNQVSHVVSRGADGSLEAQVTKTRTIGRWRSGWAQSRGALGRMATLVDTMVLKSEMGRWTTNRWMDPHGNAMHATGSWMDELGNHITWKEDWQGTRGVERTPSSMVVCDNGLETN